MHNATGTTRRHLTVARPGRRAPRAGILALAVKHVTDETDQWSELANLSGWSPTLHPAMRWQHWDTVVSQTALLQRMDMGPDFAVDVVVMATDLPPAKVDDADIERVRAEIMADREWSLDVLVGARHQWQPGEAG